MNIKSLLLGSAAALVAVSGARAADAVVMAEPEPMEYVRICDVYGTGYFYIPGTETCLKVGGRVRFDIGAGDAYTPDSFPGYRTKSRAEIYMDSGSETEYGTLKTQGVFRFDFDGDYNDGTHTTTRLIAANIQLAGFLVGLADSQFVAFTGYAGDIINDDVVYDGPYETNQIQYTFNSNGFTGTIAVEDDGLTEGGDFYGEDGSEWGVDVVGGLGYKFGDFGVKAVGGYDQSLGEGAVKVRADAKFGSIRAFVMGGYNTDGSSINKYAGSNFGGAALGYGWGDWAVWGGLGTDFSETLAGNVQVAYTDSEVLAVAANLKWYPVPGLLVEPEIAYTKWDGDKFLFPNSADDDEIAGILRFQRNF